MSSDESNQNQNKVTMFGRKRFGQEVKQITYNVYRYYKKRKLCKDTEEYQADVNLTAKVAEITGITKGTVGRIIREGNNMEIETGCVDFKPTDKKKMKRKKKIIIDDIAEGIIRRKAIKLASLTKVHNVLNEENILYCSKEHLRQLMPKLGFTSSHSPKLTEATVITTERQSYLEAVKYFREQDRPIFYLSETKRWFGSDTSNIKEMPSLVMIHSSGTTGFLNKAISMLKMKPKSKDDECFEHFENYDWIKDVVMRNLPPESVVIINIPYCETPESMIHDEKPTDTSKTSLESWLKRHNIKYNEHDPESELLELINSQDSKIEFSFTKILKESGHDVLYLPENHHDLNPAAFMWRDIKENAEKTSAKELFTNYTMEKLKECLNCVKINEAEYNSYCIKKIKEQNVDVEDTKPEDSLDSSK